MKARQKLVAVFHPAVRMLSLADLDVGAADCRARRVDTASTPAYTHRCTSTASLLPESSSGRSRLSSSLPLPKHQDSPRIETRHQGHATTNQALISAPVRRTGGGASDRIRRHHDGGAGITAGCRRRHSRDHPPRRKPTAPARPTFQRSPRLRQAHHRALSAASARNAAIAIAGSAESGATRTRANAAIGRHARRADRAARARRSRTRRPVPRAAVSDRRVAGPKAEDGRISARGGAPA